MPPYSQIYKASPVIEVVDFMCSSQAMLSVAVSAHDSVAFSCPSFPLSVRLVLRLEVVVYDVGGLT